MRKLYDQVSKAIEAIDKSTQNHHNILEEKNRELGLAKTNPISNFFAKMRNLFGRNKIKGIYGEKEISRINSPISEYREIDNDLFNYNLKDNIVESISKGMKRTRWNSKEDMSEFLESVIVPDLKNLGLEDKISELKGALGFENKTLENKKRFVERVDIDFNTRNSGMQNVDNQNIVNNDEKQDGRD